MNLLIIAILYLFSAIVLVAQIPRFTFIGTPQGLTGNATLTMCTDGTLVINAGNKTAFAISGGSDVIRPIPGLVPLPSKRYTRPERWYHEDGHWMAVTATGLSISGANGLVEIVPENVTGLTSFVWNDTTFIRGKTMVGVARDLIAVWSPGDTALVFDTTLGRRLAHVYDPQLFSDGTVWLGGVNGCWWFTRSGQLEDIDSGCYQDYCPNATPVLVNELGSTINVLMMNQSFSNCAYALTFSLKAPGDVKGLGYGVSSYVYRISRGHGQYGIGILPAKRRVSDRDPDSIYILHPDMTSRSVRPFLGIDELNVLDLVYDPNHYVYYALTERGLYRSDRVTSVALDVHRPASDIPLQTSWYNTLGEQVSPPTRPGLYLKIEIDDKGRMVTEKVAIP